MVKKKPVDLTKVIKPDLTKVIDQITSKVVDQISPKIDEIFNKVSKKFEVEIKEIRKTIEALQLPTPSTDPNTPDPSGKPMGGLGDQLENIIGQFASGQQPLTSVDPNQQSSQSQQSPMNLFEMIKIWKMIDGDGGSLGGISPKMMQEIGMRQQISMTNMMNNLFSSFMQQTMKKLGTDQHVIDEMVMTNEHLMGKVHHLGSDNKKKELGDHIREMANNFKHKES